MAKTTPFMLIIAGAVAATALSACGDKDGSGQTLATVNGTSIKESLVDKQLQQIPANLLAGHETEAKRQVVEGLIQQDLLLQAAKQAHVTGSDAYKQQMEQFSKQLQANLVIAQKVSDTVTEDALKQAYEATKAQRAFPAVKARHILVPTEQAARDIIKVATPSNFAELAKKDSKGPSAGDGGELGWFRREAMIPEFATVAFNTPVGTVAKEPVKTQFGWHVILVEDRQQSYTPPFEQVEPQLKAEMSQSVAQGYVQELRKNATVTYNDASVNPSTTAPAAGK